MTTTQAPLRTKVYGLALIAAPLLLLASTVFYLFIEDGFEQGIIGGTLHVWGSYALIIGGFGIARLLEPRFPRWSTTLLVMMTTGSAAGALFGATAIHQGAFGQYTDYVNAVIEQDGDPFGLLAYIPWGWFLPVGFVLAGILVWRSRVAPAWSALALIAAGVVAIAGRPAAIGPVILAGDVLLVVALTRVGLALLGAAAHAPRLEAPSPVGTSQAH